MLVPFGKVISIYLVVTFLWEVRPYEYIFQIKAIYFTMQRKDIRIWNCSNDLAIIFNYWQPFIIILNTNFSTLPHLSTKNIFIIQGYLSPRTERKQVKFEHKQHIPRNVRKNEWLVLFPLLLRYSYFNSKQVINFPAKSFPHSS